MKTIFSILVTALLLGAPCAEAQTKETGIWVPLPVSQMHGPVACSVKGIDLYDEGSCLVVKRILKGAVLPFGPTLGVMADINYVCQKGFNGFMDETFHGAIKETRETHFKLIDFACFKRADAKGVAQEPGPWIEEVRELVSDEWHPKVPLGAAPSQVAARKARVKPSSFRTYGTKIVTERR